MSIVFKPDNHQYLSLDNPDKEWISVSTLVSALKEPFDPIAQSIKSSKNSKSKWYGLNPTDIQQAWKNEGKRSTDLGTFYHQQREDNWIASGLATTCEWREGVKYALPQQLTTGVYIEFITYLESAGIIGQVDRIEVRNNTLFIHDYKTNKTIERRSYCNWEGVYKKMQKPLHHIEDCSFNHYALQLSMYAYCLLRHNPLLSLGKLIIEHVTFEEGEPDKWGYPVTLLDAHKQPIVKTVEDIEVPYLSNEVQTLVQWIKEPKNRQLITKH